MHVDTLFTFFVAVIKERVCYGVWFQRDKNPCWGSRSMKGAVGMAEGTGN